MAHSYTVLHFDEFTSGALDSLSWYDLGSSDTLQIAGCPPLSARLETDMSAMAPEAFLHHVQVLSAQLLSGTLSIGLDTAKRLAFQASQVMSRELCNTGDRAQRMWAQRLNYTLQPLITLAEPEADLSVLLGEEVLEGQKPWDALRTQDALWWISSDQINLHCRTPDGQTGLSLALPTQIDPLKDGTLSVGSLYSNGAALVRGTVWEQIDHDTPVLLILDWRGTRYLLDTRAQIWTLTSRQLVHVAPCQQVHFARIFDGVAYLLNNGDFGHITRVDLATGQITRQPVLPVQVCNDIAVTEDAIYLIDKQQGSVFAFDRAWRYRSKRLSFGAGYGQLSDPVSLRQTPTGLACVSWLTHKLTQIALF